MTKGISNGDRLYFVVLMGDTVWYNPVNSIKVNIEIMYERRNSKVPFFVEHLAEHRLRMGNNMPNKMVIYTGKKYPKSRYMTVIVTNPINP